MYLVFHRMLHVNEQEETRLGGARSIKPRKMLVPVPRRLLGRSRAPSPPRAATSGEYLPNPERRVKIAPLAVEL